MVIEPKIREEDARMNTLPTLVELVKTHGPTSFTQKYPGLYLLRRLREEEIEPQKESLEDLFSGEEVTHRGYALYPNDATGKFGRMIPDPLPDLHSPPHGEAELVRNFACYPIAKSNRNVFPNGPTIGRTRNNDIVIPLPAISKFHAWCQKERDGIYIYDARSRFGTFLDENPVPPEGDRGLLLRPGARLRLGDVTLLTLDEKSLYQWIVSKCRKEGGGEKEREDRGGGNRT